MTRSLHRSRTIRLALISAVGLMLGGCLNNRVATLDQGVPSDYRQRHPIMVSPHGAYVASQCGQWPHDTGPSDMAMSGLNKPYWNFGCATQQNLAAMVARPNDLLTPRAEGQLDAARRQTSIGKYRRGEQPQIDHQPIVPLTNVRSGAQGGS